MTRRGYALLAVLMAALTAYLSFVPFDFEPRSFYEACRSFVWVLNTRTFIVSRSDFIANGLLGVPLGFFLLGAVRVDRGGLWRNSLIALTLWPICVVYPALVEFGQLFFHGRTSSATDIAAQAAGSAGGMILWMIVGRTVTHFIRHIAYRARLGSTAGRMLVVYLVFCVWLELLPMDVSVSPGPAYRKLQHGTTFIPFGEGWTPLDWLQSFVLYLPAGLLLARLPKRTLLLMIVVAVPIVAEMGQVLVSRHPSATDLLFSIIGLFTGRWLMKICTEAKS